MTFNVYLEDKNYISDIQPLIRSFYPNSGIEFNVDKSSEHEAVSIKIILPENKEIPLEVILDSEVFAEIPKYGEKNAALRDGSDKVALRNCLKRLVYKALSKHSGIKLPWGCLTGIRPTRIALARLNNGISADEIYSVMRDTYYVSDEKIRLSLEIAQREKDIISNSSDKNGYSLYVGIPFCPTTCLYCSFASNPIGAWKDRVSDYLDAVCREMEVTSQMFKDRTLDSVYVGGGTPTALSAEEMDRLLTSIESYFDLSGIKEYCVESGRPDSIDEAKLKVMKRHGVDRISINPQTFSDDTLKLIGRHHTAQQTIDAFKLARKCGFDNINMDIIMGLPGETIDDVKNTLDVVRKLAPDSLTVHSLALKRASHLGEWMEKNGSDTIVNTPEMMELTAKFAAEMGLLPYYLYRQKNMAGNFENVGYAKENKAGIYNILMMEEVQTIVALGAGTITKRVSLGDGVRGSIQRCDNVKDVKLYIEKIDEMIERKRKLFGV